MASKEIATKVQEAAWTKVKAAKVRAGSKAPWFEIEVIKEDGSVVKLIAKKVDRFYSERDPAHQL